MKQVSQCKIGTILLALAAAAVLGPWSLSPARAQAGPKLPPPNGTTSTWIPDHLARKGTTPRAASLPAPPPATALVVFLRTGSTAAAVAKDYGLAVQGVLPGRQHACVLRAASAAAAAKALPRLAADRRVGQVYADEHTQYQHCDDPLAWPPNDILFAPGWLTGDFWHYGQWNLYNFYIDWYGIGVDANVTPAWIARSFPGQGVVVGIVDEGVETAHEDLAPNIDLDDSYNFESNNPDPNPTSYEAHGTAVAGIVAARGGNSLGVTGAAPFATLSGQKITYSSAQTTSMFAAATLYHSSGDNTSVKVKNHSYGYGSPFVSLPVELAALTESAGAGTIHCFAAGNNRGGVSQDVARLATSNSPDVICVAGLDFWGTYTYYSDFGANVFVTAPTGGTLGITTTDLSYGNGYNGFPWVEGYTLDNYTPSFGGTSAASPLVAGIMALGKQAQPALDVRFAKHLLALTSRPMDLFDSSIESDGGWKTNAAGYAFNQNYGFGLIDAGTFTTASTQYVGVTPRTTATTGNVVIKGRAGMIPDNNSRGISFKFNLTGDQPLEEVLVKLNITHSYRGDLEAYLTSPAGTTSRLFIRSAADGGRNINGWTFSTNAFWGENPTGAWTLNVRDLVIMDRGTLVSYAVTARMGDLIPHPAGH